MFHLHILTHWGSRRVDQTTRGDIRRPLEEDVAAGQIATARKMRNTLRHFYNWAVDRETVPTTPAAKLMSGVFTDSKNVGRGLRDDELPAFWAAADEMGYAYGDPQLRARKERPPTIDAPSHAIERRAPKRGLMRKSAYPVVT